MTVLQIAARETEDGQVYWIPNHPGYRDKVACYDDFRPHEEIRELVWSALEALYPGEFTLA